MHPQEFCQKINHQETTEAEILELINQSAHFSSSQLKTFIDYLGSCAAPMETPFKLLDCCGTGGDGAHTFNISTCAAIIAASSGIKIAKNGGRRSSSKTGSVDVLEELGLNLEASFERKISGLEKFNLAFFSSKVSAELLAPVKNTCKKFKRTSFLSLIAPFISPININYQVIGVGKTEWTAKLIEISQEFIAEGRRERIILVSSELNPHEYLDEISTNSNSQIIQISKQGIQELSFNPKAIGIENINFENLKVENPSQSAALINKIIDPDSINPAIQDCRTIASLNSALLIYCGLESNLAEGSNELIDKLGQYYKEALKLINQGQSLENWLDFKDYLKH